MFQIHQEYQTDIWSCIHPPHQLCKQLLTEIPFLLKNHNIDKKLIKYFGHCHHHFLDLTHWMALINEPFLLRPKTKDAYWEFFPSNTANDRSNLFKPTTLDKIFGTKNTSQIGQELKTLINVSARPPLGPLKYGCLG